MAKYCTTFVNGDVEIVVVSLPLSMVPGFNSINPPKYTYLCPDEVEKGWIVTKDELGNAVFSPPGPPTAAELVAAATDAVQKKLDSEARTHGYDNIMSLASYASNTPTDTPMAEQFRIEGNAGKAWRSSCWQALYELQAAIEAGTIPAPTTLDQARTLALNTIPPMIWPN